MTKRVLSKVHLNNVIFGKIFSSNKDFLNHNKDHGVIKTIAFNCVMLMKVIYISRTGVF